MPAVLSNGFSLNPRSGLVPGTRNAILCTVTGVTSEERKQLRMIACAGCGAKVFIPGDLQPLAHNPVPKVRLRHHDADAFAAV